MEESGFDCVRVPIAWSLLEPSPHRFSSRYLDRLLATVHLLEAHGLHVILDMHLGQSWGPEADVPSWLTLSGLPDWQLLPGRRWAATSSPRNLFSYGYFWISQVWQRDLGEAWSVLAARFRNDAGLVGYDLINEPHPIPIPPGIFGARFVFPDYASLIDQIARIDPNHLFLVEGTLFSGLPTDVDPIRGRGVVYSPHLYVGSTIGTVTSLLPDAVQREVGQRTGEARAVGAPLVFGEVGLSFAQPEALSLEDGYLDAMSAVGAGWLWWEWREDGGWGIRNTAGTTVDWPALRHLATPYLEAAPAGVRGSASGSSTLTLHVAAAHQNAAAVVAWPGLLSGTPRVTGSCLAGQQWDPTTARLSLGLVPGRSCSIQIRSAAQ